MKILKKIGVILLIFILAIVPLVYGVAYFFRDDIKAYAIEELNNNLATKMSIDGIDFSLFSAFPNVSLKLTNVKLQESNNVTGGDLIQAKEVLLVFNIISVLQQDFKFYKLVIKDAKLNFCISSDGKVNYDIMKKSGDEAADEEGKKEMEIDFQSIELVNTFVQYSNKKNNQGYSAYFDQAALKGNFKETAYTMSAIGEGKILAVSVDGKEYFKDKSLFLSSRLNVTGSKYQFAESAFTINGLDFTAKGDFIVEDDVTMDIDLVGDKMTIQSFLSLLPNDMAEQVNDLGSEGDFYFNAKLKGSTADLLGPELNASFGVENGVIKKEDMKLALTEVKTKGSLKASVSNLKESELNLNNITALLNGKRVNGDIKVVGLENPYLYIKSNGQVGLADVKEFAGLDGIEYMRGLVNFSVNLSGKADDFKTQEGFARIKSKGDMAFANISFKVKDNHLKYDAVSGEASLNEGDLKVKEVKGKVAGNQLAYTGEITNLLPYILKDNQRMIVKGRMTAESLSVNALLPEKDPNTGKAELNNDNTDNALANLPNDIKLLLTFDIGTLKYDEFAGEKITGKLAFTKDYINVSDVRMVSSGGDWYFKADLRPLGKDQYVTEAILTCNGVDIRELFRQFDNFGQSSLTYENIKGRLSFERLRFGCIYDKQFNAKLDQLKTYASLTIEDGQLLNYEPLMGLSNHIKVEELKDIKFETLKNTIRIEDEVIDIPQMEIKNSALNIKVSGKHTFENYLDYRFQLKLSDYLNKKYAFRSKLNKDDYEVEEGSGAVHLFVLMTGHIDNLVYRYDKKEVKEQIKKNVKDETKVAGKVIKDEFNFIFNRDKDTSISNSSPDELDNDDYGWDE